MRTFWLILVLFVVNTSQAFSQEFDLEEKSIIAQMKALTASMYKNGSGGKGYAEIISPDYTRWTSGSEIINDRVTWLKGINDWLNAGWRISDSKNNILEIKVSDNFAFVRRIATETYSGPNGENQVFQSGVVEVWRRAESTWLLLQASISPKQIK